MPTVTQDRIAALIAAPRGEDPVVSLFLRSWGQLNERKATLKNLLREGEAQVEADTGWDDERKKQARALLERLRERCEVLLEGVSPQGRGAWALFASRERTEELPLPLDLRERIVVDRSPYASPLSSLIDQYERYGVILCDAKRARLCEVYLGVVEGWEELESEHERKKGIPAGGPARTANKAGLGTQSYAGLEELRRRHHAEYVLHQHLAEVADRAWRRHKVRPVDRWILAGNREVLPLLEEHLHSYLRERVVARENWALDLAKDDVRERVIATETRVEADKERALLAQVTNHRGAAGMACVGFDETLTSLFYGKVRTLIVMDGPPQLGRECPECHYLFLRPQDEQERTPTLVECPICKRPTRRVPDVVDEAVELAILSGARVEHVNYAQEQLKDLGGMAGILRFK